MQKTKNSYSSLDLIKICKRDNNKKRGYLIVNPCQGKHVPVRPFVALELFRNLGEKVDKYIADTDRVLVISFAETATAIGAGIVSRLSKEVYYTQTTREDVKEAEYLFFSEVHSHASEQRVVKNGLSKILRNVNKIIFAEDEVTTGRTICNLITRLKDLVEDGRELEFCIASILNGMDQKTEFDFRQKGIPLLYLEKSNNALYEKEVEHLICNGKMNDKDVSKEKLPYTKIMIHDYMNPRKLVSSNEYDEKCKKFAKKVVEKIHIEKGTNILVLGTEEFMYPAILAGYYLELEDRSVSVKFHATTRSPVLPSCKKEYILRERYELSSLYDEERITYLYNLTQYNQVVIITDAVLEEKEGIRSLINALEKVGNKKITVFEWGE